MIPQYFGSYSVPSAVLNGQPFTPAVNTPQLLQRSGRSEMFDMLPPIAAEAAYAIHAITKGADEGLIRSQLIAAMAAAVAPLYRIRLPSWKPIPLQIPVICVGRAGVAKTAVFLQIKPPFEDFARRRDIAFAHETEAFELSESLRMLQIDELKRALRSKQTPATEREAMKAEVGKLERPPARPKRRRRKAGRMQFEKLIHALDGDNEAVDFFFNEGDEELVSALFLRHAGYFNDLHDGEDSVEPPEHRSKSPHAKDANVSLLFLLRESALTRFLPVEKDGKPKKSKLVDMGFFARFLVCVVEHLPRASSLWSPEDPDAAVAALHAVILALLERHHTMLVDGITERIELELAPEALSFWETICREVRAKRASGTSPIDEHLGKLESLTARLAAILHVLESDSRQVSHSALQRAWCLVIQHLPNYERAFAPPPPPRPPKGVQLDAYELANLLKDAYFGGGHSDYTTTISACASRLHLSRRRILCAARMLEAHRIVAVSVDGEMIEFRNLMNSTRYLSHRL